MAVIVKAKGRRKGSEPTYAALHRVADRQVGLLTRTIVTAMQRLRDRFTVDEWVTAITTGHWSELLAKLDDVTFTKAVNPAELEPIVGTLLNTYVDSGMAALQWQGLSAAQVAVMRSKFTLVNPEAVRWAQDHAGSLVSGIVDQNKLAIRQIISTAMAQGGHPYDTAQLIQHTIGLAPRQVTAVGNFRAGLLEAIDNGSSPSSLAGRFGLSPVRYPGQMTPGRVEEFTRKYADNQLQWRARTIARTETMTAANYGQQGLWESMMGNGFLEPTARKVFIVTDDDRLCEECASYDGQTVEVIGGSFSSDLSDGTVEQPPIHGNCRCTTGLEEEASSGVVAGEG